MQFLNSLRLSQVHISEVVRDEINACVEETVPSLGSGRTRRRVFKFFVGFFEVLDTIFLVECLKDTLLNEMLLKLFQRQVIRYSHDLN